ncbi:GAF domain-containing protein [Streptacidiphilus monticola]
MIGSVLLVDGTGRRLVHGAAPSLPDSYNKAVDGTPIAPGAGSCGTAAYRREMVVVSDIASDPLWEGGYRTAALRAGLAACWSSPIMSSAGELLGTFAMYHRTPGSCARRTWTSASCSPARPRWPSSGTGPSRPGAVPRRRSSRPAPTWRSCCAPAPPSARRRTSRRTCSSWPASRFRRWARSA